MNVLAVFRNRNETLNFSKLLNKYRISNEVISTPSGIGAVCGISVIFNERYLTKIITYLKTNNMIGFINLYYVLIGINGGFRYEKIIIR